MILRYNLAYDYAGHEIRLPRFKTRDLQRLYRDRLRCKRVRLLYPGTHRGKDWGAYQ